LASTGSASVPSPSHPFSVFASRADRARRSFPTRRSSDLVDGCYRPPLNSSAWLERFSWLDSWGQRHQLPGGGFYFLRARRQTLSAIPRRQRTIAFPALGLPPLVAGNRRAHKRDKT